MAVTVLRVHPLRLRTSSKLLVLPCGSPPVAWMDWGPKCSQTRQKLLRAQAAVDGARARTLVPCVFSGYVSGYESCDLAVRLERGCSTQSRFTPCRYSTILLIGLRIRHVSLGLATLRYSTAGQVWHLPDPAHLCTLVILLPSIECKEIHCGPCLLLNNNTPGQA